MILFSSPRVVFFFFSCVPVHVGRAFGPSLTGPGCQKADFVCKLTDFVKYELCFASALGVFSKLFGLSTWVCHLVFKINSVTD